MKAEYDFSQAEQGRFSRPLTELEIPVYLEKDLQSALVERADREHEALDTLVNALLRASLKPRAPSRHRASCPSGKG